MKRKASPSKIPLILVAISLCLLAISSIFAISRLFQSTDPRSQASDGWFPGKGMSISGNQLLHDNKPFVPNGYIITGRIAPKDTKGLNSYLNESRLHFGFKELDKAKELGANTIRFNVTQAGLDPKSPYYSKAYVDEVYDAVRLTTGRDFVVIIAMFGDQNSPDPTYSTMPTEATKRAWSTVVPLFDNYGNVMLELFNEPAMYDIPQNWEVWKNGGQTAVITKDLRQTNAEALNPGEGVTEGATTASTATVRAVGHQELVDHVRAAGAKNVLIVNGLFYGRSVNENYTLRDPMNKLAYSVHPFFSLGKDLGPNPEAEWDARFGNFSKKHPVIATAWSAHNFYKRVCRPNAPELTKKFLTYMKQNKIGVIGWAIDIPGTLVSDWEFTPTNFDQFTCDKLSSGGGGQLLSDYFKSL